MISAEKITRDEFDEILARYPALIGEISNSKTPSGESVDEDTLEQLDKFRFEIAPELYFKADDVQDLNAPPMPLSHEHVLKLVKWKLKHGTFRPNLMKLAESNLAEDTVKATQEAFVAYKQDEFSVAKAINKLTSLSGIGPATASLILSVHDPSKVVFFSDELFLWACHDGKKPQIKYTLKEYEELTKKSRDLMDRLGVDGRALEQVGFVLVQEAASKEAASKPEAAKANGEKPKGRGRPKNSAGKPAQKKEPKLKPERKAKPFVIRTPTDMTEERKAQLQEIAARGRAAREAKKLAKLEKGTKFRERVDAAREKKKNEVEVSTPKTGTKRKSDIGTRNVSASSKRTKRA